MSVFDNIFLWIGTSFAFIILCLILFILLIIIFKKTHAAQEIKAWVKNRPIVMYFNDHRYCEWKVIQPEAGIIVDKDYGAHIINEKGVYVDKMTKTPIVPCHADIGVSINMTAAKLANSLQDVIKDQKQLWLLREAISKDMIVETDTIKAISSSIELGAMKHMLTAMIPHNINAKIEKVIAQRMKSLGMMNPWNYVLIFAAILGAIVLGVIIVKKVL